MQPKNKPGRGGVRPGSGRPPLPAKLRKRNRIMLNFTDAEYQALVDSAGDQPVSVLARDIVLRYLRRRKPASRRGES